MENLEDVCTSGRVTRSLRKRLTSVDSNDAGSRPSTPQLAKLVSIPESSSPSRSLRATRRNSATGNSTPSKTSAMPKTSTISESHDVEINASKRNVRRSSVSGTDSHTSKKVSQVDIATAKISELPGEDYVLKTITTPARRSTRLISKSPSNLEEEGTAPSGPPKTRLQSKSPPHLDTSCTTKTIIPGPKSKRDKQESDSDSDVEVINLKENPETDEKAVKTPKRVSSRLKKSPNSASPKNNENKETTVESLKSPGPKSKRDKQESDSDSDVEVINLEENPETDEKAVKTPKRVSSRLKKSPNSASPKNKRPIIESIDLSEETVDSHVNGGTEECLILQEDEKETSPLKENKEESLRLELSEDDNKAETDSTTKTPVKYTSPKKALNSSQNGSSVQSVVMLQRLSPDVIKKLCGENNTEVPPPNAKSVAFNGIEEDDAVKSTYPKTPASIKSKSYISMDSSEGTEEKSFETEKGLSSSFKDDSALVEESKEQTDFEIQTNQLKESVELPAISNGDEEENMENEVEMIQDYTPHKQKLHTNLQSSTPMANSVSTSKTEPVENIKTAEEKSENFTTLPETSPTKSIQASNNCAEISFNHEKIPRPPIKEDEAATATLPHQQQDLSATTDNNATITADEPNNLKNDEIADDLFSKSWTQNVSGCATSAGKIDTIHSITSENKINHEVVTSENLEVEEEPKISTTTSPKIKNNEESEEEEDSFQKLEFVDDEAMEAPIDYESGDSMSEEERKEMEENEIVDLGESIGSEDTEGDRSYEECDEENDSFITSDTHESLLDYSDDDDEHCSYHSENSKPSKGNSHILVTSESEGEENSSKEEVVNGILKKKTKRLNRSNRRSRILDPSESENEEMLESKSKKTNQSIQNSSPKPSKPLNFDVSRMIDETTEEETSGNENFSKIQSVPDKTDKSKETNSSDQTINGKYTEDNANSAQSEDGNESKDKRDNNKNELTERNITSLIQGSEQKADNESSKDINTDLDKLDESNSGKVAEKTGSSPVKSQSDEIMENIAEKTKSSPKKSVSDEIMENVMPAEKANDTNTDINKNDSANESKLNISINRQNESDEINKINNLNDSKSENEISENENGEGEFEDIEIPETQEVDQVVKDDSSDVSLAEESADENVIEDTECVLSEISKPKISDLSVSFCQTKQKRKSIGANNSLHHNSFTIGVSVIRKENANQIEESDSTEPNEKICTVDNNSSESGTDNTAKTNDAQVDKEEEEELEKLLHFDTQFSNLSRKRKSIASINPQSTNEHSNSKKPRRQSLQRISKEEFNPSQSLIENIEDRKRELQTQRDAVKSRLSKSFCGAMQEESNAFASSSASDISSNESENNKKVVNYSNTCDLNTNKNRKKDLAHISERCDNILEAANRAKLESKQNSKKRELIFPKSKKGSKHSVLMDEETEEDTLIVEDMKHSKEQKMLALEQAFEASAKILLNEGGRNKKEKLQIDEEESGSKRLPIEFLKSFSNSELQTEIKKSKGNKETHPSFVQRMNSATGEIIEERLTPPKKKRAVFNKFELPTGTVFEEPITPKKKTKVGEFRESPITPRTLGFKVRHILTAGQDQAPELKNSRQLKRKQKIDEPKHVLPKPQWSQSGVFLEEHLPSLSDKKRHKFKAVSTTYNCEPSAGTATLNALHFKKSTMFRKNVPRESSNELLKRKERQYARNHF
ncbi:protein slender lobes isoform X2 [Anastrepha obliqua]|uniref:protein slender lobes isoform X2 n=1 Tax=Anastrepha obliqua TaxID=95512 RepID=UPI002408FE71|nr:protein slender lobes isoform X2 [Anastrepha obliqua]